MTPTLTTLVSFTDLTASDAGAYPRGDLIADSNGDLFGTTSAGGGADNDGTVFEIKKTAGGYASTPTNLATFGPANGETPLAGLIADANGDLFGTTSTSSGGTGTVFEVAKTAGGYASTPTTLASFNDGFMSEAGLIADAKGDLFGTTALGGANYYDGTVFEIAKTSGGYASAPTTLVSFDGADGAKPVARLIADANGDLLGTTARGGRQESDRDCEDCRWLRHHADHTREP